MSVVTIRPLTVAELPRCEPLARAFFAEKHLHGVFSMPVFTHNWTLFLTTPGYDAVIFGLFCGEELTGVLGALMAPDVNTGMAAATELFWFVDVAHRRGSGAFRLIRAFESWSRAHAASECRMSNILGGEGDRLPKIYERLGYRPFETAHIKVLTQPKEV